MADKTKGILTGDYGRDIQALNDVMSRLTATLRLKVAIYATTFCPLRIGERYTVTDMDGVLHEGCEFRYVCGYKDGDDILTGIFLDGDRNKVYADMCRVETVYAPEVLQEMNALRRHIRAAEDLKGWLKDDFTARHVKMKKDWVPLRCMSVTSSESIRIYTGIEFLYIKKP